MLSLVQDALVPPNVIETAMLQAATRGCVHIWYGGAGKGAQRGYRAPSHTAAAPRPFPEHVFYVVFVLPATPQLPPELSRSTYFTWFSCSQPINSYAQTFPGARILRVFSCSEPRNSYAQPATQPASKASQPVCQNFQKVDACEN